MQLVHSLFFVFSVSLMAQTATLRGVISDETGAIIPGAKVTITGPVGLSRTTAAANNGSYTFADLTPDGYWVQASAPRQPLTQTRSCYAERTWTPFQTIRTTSWWIYRLWPGRPPGRTEARSSSTDSAAGSYRRRTVFARFALIRIRFRRSTTGWALA